MTHKTYFYFILSCVLFARGSFAQTTRDQGEDALLQYNTKQQPVFIKSYSSQQVSTSDHLNWLKKQLRLSEDESFKLLRTTNDDLGFSHYRYQLLFRNYPVEHKTYLVHVKNGQIKSANGDYVRLANLESEPKVDESVALQQALKEVGAIKYEWEEKEAHTLSHPESSDSIVSGPPKAELIYAERNGVYQLCYRFDIYAHQPLGRYFVYVNAINGSIVKKEEGMQHADVVGLGNTYYYGLQPITTEQTANGFRLRETGRGNGIETYTLNGGTNFDQALDITDADNYWDSLPGNLINGVQAHFGTEATYDYFKHVHNRNSIDDNGFKLLSYVLYDGQQEQSNAYWDGQRMVYTSPGTNSPAVTILDVVGHEITHGLSQFTANFSRMGEAAAINESCSDIFGALIERYRFPDIQDSANFVTGEQIVAGGARSFIDPNATSCPDTYKGQHWDTTGQRYHHNGVVQSYWFYILARGKSGVNDKGNAFDVDSIGIEKVSKIMFRALTNYYTSDMNFEQARIYTMEAAKDLYGDCSEEVKRVANAWYAVGVGEAYTDTFVVQFRYQPVLCADPVRINFDNTSNGATEFLWNFGDGQTSTESSPSHEYPVSGQYQVQLSAKSCLNSSQSKSKSEMIFADNANRCDEITFKKTGKLESVSCRGVFYDDGKDSVYSDNTNGSLVLMPPNASGFNFLFESFEMGAFQDQLIIYEGNGLDGTTLHTFSIFSPPPKELRINYPVITIQQKTDDMNMDGAPKNGFKVFWECIRATGLGSLETHPEILVYPNPANQKVTVRIQSAQQVNGATFRIFNQLGMCVAEQQMKDMETIIDIGSLPSGVYIYEVKGDRFVTSAKLMIH